MKRAVLAIFIFILALLAVLLFFSRQKKDGFTEFFTFIVLPDTQKYTMYNPDMFKSQTEWIIKNRNSLHIKFVSHLGDIVQSGALENNEWEIASNAMLLLEKENIPYSIIPGNHDVDSVDVSKAEFTKYNKIFPLSRFSSKIWFGGNYHEYQNNYQIITIQSVDFIILNVEVDPANDVLNWANEVLSKHKDRKAIFITHAYLQDDTGERSQKPHFRENGNSGDEIWNEVIKRNCNVFLVLSGHFHSMDGENRLISTNDCGQPVNQVVQDYQSRENGGNGLLRIYKFYPSRMELQVSTYSPITNRYERDENSEFMLKLPF